MLIYAYFDFLNTLLRPESISFFNYIMKPNSESSSNDKIPSFFLKDDNITKDSPPKRNDQTNAFNDLAKPPTGSSKLTIRIHWPSMGIGALVAIICIFCGILMTNFTDTESTQILDEVQLKEIEPSKKHSLSLFIDNASPYLGNKNAPLTMIEFGDYQCTFCSKFFHETEEAILTNYVKTGKVKILFKDFIILGNDSINAANAAHCANDQKMFWEYHSILYNNWDGENTGWASLEHLYEFANTLELEMIEFSECMTAHKWIELIDSSSKDGRALDVTGTPTFFVIDQSNNVIKITGAQQYDVFKQIFDSALMK